MEPMKPMEPMKGMEPMKPMEPMMSSGEAWWPSDLGKPSSSGSQNGMRYAFFSDKRRLLVEQNGKTTTYDSGSHKINGVSQRDSGARSLAFSDGGGSVTLDDLKVVG